MNSKENFFTGKNILQSDIDTLEPLNLRELYDMMQDPGQQLIELSTHLMKIKSIDDSAYNRLKTKLPYFIGARFENNIRKTNNFIGIDWVIIDIDKCFNSLDKEMEMKDILRNDQRIALMYTSPSNEGLKLVFKLAEPITDSALYVNFYKAFTAELARHYKLEKYIDFKTSDVTRVSFLNADSDAFINEEANCIDWRTFLSKYDIISQNEKPENGENDDPEKKKIDEAVYAEILQKLNPKTPKREKIIFVPEALNSIVEPVSNLSIKMGLKVEEVRDIHYGKKFVFKHEYDFAEINVFYGKSGFTVVISPKRGHNPALSEAAKAIIEKILFDDSLNTDLAEDEGQIFIESIKNINLN